MLIALMIGCLILGVGTFYVVKRLRPMICPIAVAEAKSIATMSINTAVNQELSVSEIGYDDLITLEMDAGKPCHGAQSQYDGNQQTARKPDHRHPKQSRPDPGFGC